MIAITRSFEWDMGHRVTNHDSLCKNPHGHRYKLEVTISGPLNATPGDAREGMVIDFGRLKLSIKSAIVDRLDHSFMYWEKDQVMTTFAAANPDLRLLAVAFVPTAECIAGFIVEELEKLLKRDFAPAVLEHVTVYETPNCRAEWRRT